MEDETTNYKTGDKWLYEMKPLIVYITPKIKFLLKVYIFLTTEMKR